MVVCAALFSFLFLSFLSFFFVFGQLFPFPHSSFLIFHSLVYLSHLLSISLFPLFIPPLSLLSLPSPSLSLSLLESPSPICSTKRGSSSFTLVHSYISSLYLSLFIFTLPFKRKRTQPKRFLFFSSSVVCLHNFLPLSTPLMRWREIWWRE